MIALTIISTIISSATANGVCEGTKSLYQSMSCCGDENLQSVCTSKSVDFSTLPSAPSLDTSSLAQERLDNMTRYLVDNRGTPFYSIKIGRGTDSMYSQYGTAPKWDGLASTVMIPNDPTIPGVVADPQKNVFQVMSVSKVIGTALFMAIVDTGAIPLHEPIVEFLPALKTMWYPVQVDRQDVTGLNMTSGMVDGEDIHFSLMDPDANAGIAIPTMQAPIVQEQIFTNLPADPTVSSSKVVYFYKKVLLDSDNSVFGPVSKFTPITLLSHMGGFTGTGYVNVASHGYMANLYLENAPMEPYLAYPIEKTTTLVDWANDQAGKMIDMIPGTKVTYGYGPDVALAAAEVAYNRYHMLTGSAYKPLAQLAKEMIFDPLDMVDTSWGIVENDPRKDRIGAWFSDNYGASAGDTGNGAAFNYGIIGARNVPSGSGYLASWAGFLTTMHDLSNLAEMYAHRGIFHGKRVLSERAVMEQCERGRQPSLSHNSPGLPFQSMYPNNRWALFPGSPYHGVQGGDAGSASDVVEYAAYQMSYTVRESGYELPALGGLIFDTMDVIPGQSVKKAPLTAYYDGFYGWYGAGGQIFYVHPESKTYVVVIKTGVYRSAKGFGDYVVPHVAWTLLK